MSGGAKVETPSQPEGGRPATAFPSDAPVVLYDGWCNLCDTSVAFLLRHDRQAVFRFAALQSQAAAGMLAGCASGERLDGTLVLVYRGRCQTRSEAVLTILTLLPRPWPVLGWLRLVPRSVRDRAYEFIAGRRRRWFGGPRACMTSIAAYRGRFVE